MLQNHVQTESVFQDGSKDQTGKTAQPLDKKNNLIFFCRTLNVQYADPFEFLRLVWFLEVDWGAGGDQQRRQELFQRSVQRVEEIKARRALEKSHSNGPANPKTKQPSKVKCGPPVAATCEVTSEPRKPKPDVQSKSGTAERSSSYRQKKVHPKNEGIKSFWI